MVHVLKNVANEKRLKKCRRLRTRWPCYSGTKNNQVVFSSFCKIYIKKTPEYRKLPKTFNL